MRHLLILIFLPLLGQSQDSIDKIFPLKEGRVYYESIITVDSVTKDQLYSRAKAWAIDNFKSQKDANQTDDKEIGLMAYRGFFSAPFQSPSIMGTKVVTNWNYWHLLKVFVKDNKAKIVIEDVQIGADGFATKSDVESYPSFITDTKGVSKKYKEQYLVNMYDNFRRADAYFKATIGSLEKALKAESKSQFDF